MVNSDMLKSLLLLLFFNAPDISKSEVPPLILPTKLCHLEKECSIQDIFQNNPKIVTPTPCEDFYKYSCQKWTTNAKKPPHELLWNKWHETSARINFKIRKILSETNVNILEETDPFAKAKKAFAACMARDKHDNLYYKELRNFADLLGGWPLTAEIWNRRNYNWMVHVAEVTKILGVNPILKFHVDMDLQNSTNHVLYINHGNLVMPRPILEEPQKYAKEIRKYKNWIYDTAKYIRKFSRIPNLKFLVQEIVDFEVKLAGLSQQHGFLRSTLSEYSARFKLNWLAIFKKLFSGTEVDVKNNEVVVVMCEKYIEELVSLVHRTEPRIISNYITWSAIKDVSRDTTKFMRKLNFAIDNAVFGVKKDIPSLEECTNKIKEYFGMAIVPKYVATHTNSKAILEVENMVQNIKLEFVKMLEENVWMTEKTRRNSVEKIINIQHSIGYPKLVEDNNKLLEYFSEFNISENHFFNMLNIKRAVISKQLLKLNSKVDRTGWPSTISPFEVNALYSILQNAIVIPLGILEEPFYSGSNSLELNYGALGSLIGHEISHSLDTKGRKADQNGEITKWWPESDIDKFNSQIQCFKNQYSTLGIDGHVTISENIADNVGLAISYAAYKNLGQNDGITNDNEEKSSIFFSSYSQMWCELQDDNEFLSEEIYSPVQVRVLGTLYNNDNFQKTFKCEANTKRCSLW